MLTTIRSVFLLFLAVICLSVRQAVQTNSETPFLVILGIAQDAGYPQMGCIKDCCKKPLLNPAEKRFVTSIALADPVSKKWWLFDATPDIREQLQLFKELTGSTYHFLPDGIFITHGHIGHYTGLMQLGREVMNAAKVPVYVMPRMKKFLSDNGPWNQLVSLNNIALVALSAESPVTLSGQIEVVPFTVPHRDEYSETAGFRIKVNNNQLLFIPDIDKWNKFDRDITAMIKNSSLALLDGTFYKEGELTGRKMNEVPHPFIEESIQLFKNLPVDDKNKIQFIHLNHTNPLLNEQSEEIKILNAAGFRLAKQGGLILLN